MRKLRANAVVGRVILLSFSACTLSLDSPLDVSQYAHRASKTGEGFTNGTIFAMAQAPDAPVEARALFDRFDRWTETA